MPLLPDFDQAEFTPGAAIDNSYYPLTPGTVSAFVGSEDGEAVESNDYFVTSLTKDVLGVTTIVVRDTAYEEGVIIEDTIDYFAQDADGNVWYFGERVINYEYDDERNFVGTNGGGQWLAGEDEALPGWIMPAEPEVDLSYYNEFADGVALDEAVVLSLDEEIETGLGMFTTLQTRDTSVLDAGVVEFKYYVSGTGLVLEEEDVDDEGEAGFINELHAAIAAGSESIPDETDLVESEDFEGDGDTHWISVLPGESELDNALGYYLFDLDTGEIGEGHILLASTEDSPEGGAFSVDIPEGQGLGLFFVPNAGELGVDLEDYEEGGLFFVNLLTDETARLTDGMAPIVTDDEGEPLPITVFHALGADDGANLLNPGIGLQAVKLDLAAVGDTTVIGFEELRLTQTDYDGDFNELLVAFADEPVDIESLLEGGGEGGNGEGEDIAGTPDDDELTGTAGDDAIYGSGGNDVITGGAGDDRLGGGNGADWFIFDNSGPTGDDIIEGFTRYDRILLTQELDSPAIELEDSVLEISNDGDILVRNVSSLQFDSMIDYGGTSYFAYEVDQFTIGENRLYLDSTATFFG